MSGHQSFVSGDHARAVGDCQLNESAGRIDTAHQLNHDIDITTSYKRLWIICEQITGNTWTLSSQITHGDTDYFKRLAGSSRKVAYAFLE
jgi:hypothetical protein